MNQSATRPIEYTIGPFSAVAMGLPGDHAGKTATRVFLVSGGERLALIDSGIHVGLPQLEAALAAQGNGLPDIDALILTHEHMDHIGNNAAIKRASGCTIYAHAGRADRIADNMLNAKTIVHAFAEGEHFDLAEEYLDWMGPDAVPVDAFVRDGETIDLGGLALEVVEVFGHSMGEIGLFDPTSRTLVIADPLLPAFNPVLYLYEDADVMRATFNKIIGFIEEREVETVLFAHEDPCSAREAIARAKACRERVDAVERDILEVIEASPGIGFAEIRDAVCDRHEKVREWRALVSVDASLRSFERQGRIAREGKGWRIA